ncbi:MAG: hypothetical protein FAF05_02765 [Epsilonproteobacteria bacterium]|nr:hypothetical protein [Campylobacterota bacterium]
MKLNIPRHYAYLALISVVLLIFVLVFSFTALIPMGKEYRLKKNILKNEVAKLKKYQNFHDETLATLKDLQTKNRHIIEAFDKPFDPQRFVKKHKLYFSQLSVTKINKDKDTKGFATYKVDTTSQINSPTNFYDFLDSVNKSDWIIEINFPIDFQREGELIKSSFTMKVYANNKESNSTASASPAK